DHRALWLHLVPPSGDTAGDGLLLGESPARPPAWVLDHRRIHGDYLRPPVLNVRKVIGLGRDARASGRDAMKPGKALLGLLTVAVVVSAVLLGHQADTPKAEPLAEHMADAARKLLDGLRPAQRQKAAFAFDDPARLQWHYYPTTPWPRKGAVL